MTKLRKSTIRLMLEKVTQESFIKLWREKFDASGKLKEDADPLAQGSFASIFPLSSLTGIESAQSDTATTNYIVRVANSPPGPAQEFTFLKELQALIAYLKLSNLGEPMRNELVWIDPEEQPKGLCNTDAYYVVATAEQRTIFTIMPLGKPLMDIIEEQLISASAGGESHPRDLSQVVAGMSQLAVALKGMHSKGIYWRDCKVDNVVLLNGKAKVIDINSGVCTVGYASHEQLAKLPLESFTDCQTVTDALERVLQDQPDHQTWETQDVFALSIVVMEWLTYGMFTYPYNRDEAAPNYADLLLYELRVYNLLLSELSDLYDVSVLKGRLDRKIKHWSARIGEGIDPTSQVVRDLTLWPLAVTEFRRDRRLFDLWAALAFWDHVDHQFGFIGHWFDWYFDLVKNAEEAAADVAPPPESPAQHPPAASDEMVGWTQRAGDRSSDVGMIKARLHERSESVKQMEEDHTARVVKRLASLTQRMDSLNSSLASFFDHTSPSRDTKSSPVFSPAQPLPSVKIFYASPEGAAALLQKREAASAGAGAGGGEGTSLARAGGCKLLEVRLRVCTSKSDASKRSDILQALGKVLPRSTTAQAQG